MQVGRNESCPCGSNKKYKNCCAEKESQSTASRGLILTVGAIVAVAAIGIIPKVIGAGKDEAPAKTVATAAIPAAVPKAQPPGPAPEGKVWSKEHGHWHDAKPSAASSGIQIESSGGGAVATMADTPRTQQPPAGAAPPGKVWSAEHGHYHSVAGATRPGPLPATDPNAIRVLGQTLPSTPPPGPAPAGKVWSPEHRHYH